MTDYIGYCLEGDFVEYSDNYGCFCLDSKYFDDSQDLGGTEDSLLHYSIKIIKIYTSKIYKNKYILGIQLTFRNSITKELKELPLRKMITKNLDENIDCIKFELQPGEYLNNFYIRYYNESEYIYQIGFETNKKRRFFQGSENGEKRIIDSNDGEKLILGTYGYYRNNLESLGVLYVDLKKYLKRFSKCYFELKFKLKKDKKFKKENEDKYETFSESDKYLFKACLLPDSVFNEIMKFCMF